MASKPNLVEFSRDVLRLKNSPAQATILAAIDGLPLASEEADIFRTLTKREPPVPGATWREHSFICGARSGKGTRLIAPTVLHRALHGEYKRERGVPLYLPIVSMDARGASNLFAAVKDYALSTRAIVAHLIDEPKQDAISFDTGVTIAVFPSVSASLRSWTIPCAAMDEYAFMGSRDVEIQASLRRGGLTFGERRLLLKATTPWSKSGLAWSDMQRLGKADPHAITWHASTARMNPSIDAADLDAERSIDPMRFAREYEALFVETDDVFLPSEWIDAAIVTGSFQVEPEPGQRYVFGVDVSGGGADHFTLAGVHTENGIIVQDVVSGVRRSGSQTLNLEATVAKYADIVKRYGARDVYGDNFAGGWPAQAFGRHGITYHVTTTMRTPEFDRGLTRSQAYLAVKPLFAERKIALLDHAVQAEQFRRLEVKRTGRGDESIDHPAGMHDDFSNATAIAAAICAKPAAVRYRISRLG